MKDFLLQLSPSRVNTFKSCRRKYFYTYISKLPRLDWPHLDTGTLVHGALEHFHEDFREDGKDINFRKLMKKSFKKQWDKTKKKLSKEIFKDAKGMLGSYVKRIEKHGIGSKIISLEPKFEIGLDDEVSILGFIDRVDLDKDGIYHIKDYKTTKSKKYMKPFQLLCYGIPLLEWYPEIERFRGSYIMMRHSGEYISYDFNREDVEKCKKELLTYADQITEEGRWLPNPSRLCEWCDFKNPCRITW